MSSGAGTSFETQINWCGATKSIYYDENLKVVHASHGFSGWQGPGHQLDTRQIKHLQGQGYKLIQIKGENNDTD